jgi:hypothetical protein
MGQFNSLISKSAAGYNHVGQKIIMEHKMKRANLNFTIDTVAFVTFVFLVSTGILMHYILPPSSGNFNELWGMNRHTWGQIHFWVAIVFITSLVVHLFLHWKWIVNVIKVGQHKGSVIRVALSVAGLIILICMALIPLFGTVEQKGEPPHKLRSIESVKNHDYNIDGSMTLKDVERLTDVPGTVILRELGLPGNLPMDENLGKLRKEYGFELNDVREVVKKQGEKIEN